MPSILSQVTEEENICVCNKTVHMHISVHISIGYFLI